MLGLNSKCWKLEDSDNSVYFRRRAKWYQTKPNCLRMSSHFLRTKPVCQNRIYGRVENWTYLSPFMRCNVFICTFYCKCSFCLKDSRLVNFLRRCGASFPKLNQPKEIFSLMTLSVNLLLCWHFCGQVLGLDHFMIPCTVCVQVHNWRNINNLLSLVWYQPHSKQIPLLLYKPANTCL